jgi:hypothetical protein
VRDEHQRRCLEEFHTKHPHFRRDND